jgi:hypothetical protein
MDIRYYLNPVAEEKTQGGDWDKAREIFGKDDAPTDIPDEPVNLSDVPF